MAKKDQQPKGDFPTMGTAPSHAVNTSGNTAGGKPVAKKGGQGGMIDSATANHHANILERNGASLRITAPLYQANAAEAGNTQRHVRLMPSALGNRDFWTARQSASE